MARGEAGSVKAIGNAMKAKGLTKLRFYCQICQKACRDENGYKCHIESETHMRQIAALGSNSGKVIDNFSKEFQDGFVSLLSRRFGTARVNANKVYQEYIQDRHHLHMNATRWVSLSEFVKHLGREGLVKVEEITEEGQFGWYVTWIDNSPAALARQDALQKMERAKVDEEGRSRKFLSQQIERAREQTKIDNSHNDSRQKAEQGLQWDKTRTPLKIGLSSSIADGVEGTPEGIAGAESGARSSLNGKSSLPAVQSASVDQASTKFKLANNPLKMKVGTAQSVGSSAKAASSLGNAFKTANRSVEAATSLPKGTSSSSRTAAERIMEEESIMRAKRKAMGPQQSGKRMRM